jgi:hypothetical protein
MTQQTEAQRLANALERDIQQTDAEDNVIHVARWFVQDAAAELRRLDAVNAQLLEALDLALRSHGVLLLSDPPLDAWRAYGVEFKARAAIAAAKGEA